MNESQLNLELYHKMREEQDEYRSWLLSQTPKEILNHACEYSVREDILATMCEGHLPPMLAKALLNAEQPLASIYRLEQGGLQKLRGTDRGDPELCSKGT